MNPYEITFIIRPDLDEEAMREAITQVTGRFETAGGEILATVPWNPPRRRMAYPINDFNDGYYVTVVFRVDPQAIRGIENLLKLNDRVLRYLLVQATATNIQQAQQRMQQAAAAAARPPQTEAPAAPRPEPAPAQAEAAPAATVPEPAAQPAAETETEVVPAAEEPTPEPVTASTEAATSPTEGE